MALQEKDDEKARGQIKLVRVIIVDNNQTVRRELSRVLSRTSQFQIIDEIPATEDAVSKVMLSRPDVVLLEVKTGDSLGLQICERIVLSVPNVSVIVLTSYLDEDERERVLMAGARAYLIKSVPSIWLTQEIKKILKQDIPTLKYS